LDRPWKQQNFFRKRAHLCRSYPGTQREKKNTGEKLKKDEDDSVMGGLVNVQLTGKILTKRGGGKNLTQLTSNFSAVSKIRSNSGYLHNGRTPRKNSRSGQERVLERWLTIY